MSFARHAYSALVYAFMPYALVRLWWRGRRERGYREHMAERFGRYSEAAPQPIIWLHAVSVGETRAAEPLVRALLERFPDHHVLLTHMTPTGRRTGETLFAAQVVRAYLPYDYPQAVMRFLRHFNPVFGVLLETEIWPNLIRTCSQLGVPLYLVNARLSERSARGYARFSALIRESLGSLRATAAQTAHDAERLRALGARDVHVTGNLKFDVVPLPAQIADGQAMRARFAQRHVLLAASTREGEETLLLESLPELPRDVLLVIVPRHPQRFAEVAALLGARGVAYVTRSSHAGVATDTRVVLGDSMGELTAYYAACDVAFIGGSLLPFGGQNLIEACAVGKPVLLGPHTYNFSEAAEAAVAAGAALRIGSAAQLMAVAARFVKEPDTLSRMGEQGLAFARQHRGATEKVMRVIEAEPIRIRSDPGAARS